MSLFRNDKGFITLATLITVSILVILGATFTSIVTLEMRNTARQVDRKQAFYIAEAGIARGWNVLKSTVNGLQSLDGILVGSDGEANTADDGILSFGASEDFSDGSYSVKVIDNEDGDGNDNIDSDDIVIISSTGSIGDIEKTIKVRFVVLTFVLKQAVVAGGDFNISGNPCIHGSHGGVYTTANLTISGNADIAKDAAASGNVVVTGNPTIGGDILAGVPPVSIPSINPDFYKPEADYELRNNGDVFDVSNQQTISNPESFNGWTYDENEWSFSSDEEVDGTYYVEGNTKISGSPGTSTEPWNVTIICTDSIEISGTPQMQPDVTDLLLVAGGDIKITGNPDQLYEGAILTHEQIHISGNVSLNGGIVVEDATDIHNVVTEDENGIDSTITGNVDITYDSILSPSFQKIYTGKLNRLSWF